MTHVVLFGRPGCHLCSEARGVIKRVQSEVAFTLEERDIEGDKELFMAYLERIPVVTIDGHEIFQFAVDEAVLRERLTGPSLE